MKITINIATGNAAFEDNAGPELARILRRLADRVEDWQGANEFSLLCLDVNGNKVGTLEAEEA